MKVTEQVMAWRSNIDVVPNHAPPIHPFDSHRRLLSILNDSSYDPSEVPDDTPTLNAHEWDRWFLLTLLGKQRYDDRKASEERELLWRAIQHDPLTDPNDWLDFMRSKRDDETQHHRAMRDEQTNEIYDNMTSISPSALATMMLDHSYQPSAAASPPARGIPNNLSSLSASTSRPQ
ncbi:uncharacterized protein BT62DRAFT_155813 [Guyanagaster necrorhizus]|uniref:Uncharacterized protein n=1 Tax=Guyanagaster necrorhizus TaxID=856835 RepID=A0A9P8ATR9_9AGAR|nr:uncharacterized protein BT62DRAFT_155813 [Guyanagaster necrorhizus MCA 3950]KAG7446152.1 hypothetical protein BT62DRAFT_155813 [Guyanagaster necrorhizus MCA 3950]